MSDGAELPDVSVLVSRLHSLSCAQSLNFREKCPLSMDDPRASLIAKIEETQLPRRLVFTNDRAGKISFFVNGGRLLGVEYFTSLGKTRFYKPSGTGDPRRVVCTVPVAEALERFFRKANQPTVRSYRFDPNELQDDEECDLPAILDISRVLSEADAIPLSPLAAFSDQCRVLAEALVVLKDGEFQVLWGDPGLLEPLKSLAMEEGAKHIEQTRIVSEDMPETACAIYSGHPSGGRSVFCATQSGAILLALCPYEKSTELITLWQSHLAKLPEASL